MADKETKPKTVLLVEDDVFVKDLYERTLTKKGYEVIVAENGQEGVAAIADNPDKIGLVLLDIMMPKMNGIDVLKNLREQNLLDQLTVVLLTNLGQESVIEEAFEIGAKGYMLKARLLPREIAEKVDTFFETGEFPQREANGI